MVPYGVPDPQKVYNIQLKKRTVAPLVGLTSEGILLSINTDGEEEPLPAVPKGNDAPKRLNPRDYMNQEILSAGSNAKIAELTAEEIYDIPIIMRKFHYSQCKFYISKHRKTAVLFMIFIELTAVLCSILLQIQRKLIHWKRLLSVPDKACPSVSF